MVTLDVLPFTEEDVTEEVLRFAADKVLMFDYVE